MHDFIALPRPAFCVARVREGLFMRFSLWLAALLPLAACVQARPVVSDYNGASVKIQTSMLADAEEARRKSDTEATRICARTGKSAEYASTRELPDYNAEHLYLCL